MVPWSHARSLPWSARRRGATLADRGSASDQLLYGHSVREPRTRVYDRVLGAGLPGDEGVAREPVGVVYGAEPVGQSEMRGAFPERARRLRGAEEYRDEDLALLNLHGYEGRLSPLVGDHVQGKRYLFSPPGGLARHVLCMEEPGPFARNEIGRASCRERV